MPKLQRGVDRKLTGEDLREYQLKLYNKQRRPLFVVGALVVCFELFMIFSVLLKDGPVNSTISRLTFFHLYIFLFLITLICLFVLNLGKKLIERKPSIFFGGLFVYSCFILFWAAYLSAFTHRNTVDFSVFLYVSLALAVLVPMRPWRAICLYSAGWILFEIFLRLYISPELDSFSSLINTGFVAVLSMVISILFHNTRVREFLDAKTIAGQHQCIKQMNDQLSMMVTVDDLTQLYNRRFMDKEFPGIIENARKKNAPIAMLMVDIDHFKQYNDHFGHLAGDECLHAVTKEINACLTEDNTYFVRYGGEEFLILMVGVMPDRVREIAEQIRCRVEGAGIEHPGCASGVVTVSVGVCCSREHGYASLTQMIRYADSAMYDAKSKGRNNVCSFMFKERPEV